VKNDKKCVDVCPNEKKFVRQESDGKKDSRNYYCYCKEGKFYKRENAMKRHRERRKKKRKKVTKKEKDI